MKLWVGLGNPGAKYAGNRHNIGFMAVDRIAADHGFSPWRAKFQGLAADGVLAGEKVILLKPQTFMNLSGQSVGAALRFHKLDEADLTVFHDELDLAPGKCRVKTGGGHAGHNGLRSIVAHGGAGFQRVRLGIGHPGHKDMVSAWVLHDFAKADADWLDDLMRGISDGAPHLAQGDSGRFLNAVAARIAPARKAAPKPEAKAPARPASAPDPAPDPSPQPAPEPAADAKARPDNRSALQKLIDRFR